MHTSCCGAQRTQTRIQRTAALGPSKHTGNYCTVQAVVGLAGIGFCRYLKQLVKSSEQIGEATLWIGAGFARAMWQLSRLEVHQMSVLEAAQVPYVRLLDEGVLLVKSNPSLLQRQSSRGWGDHWRVTNNPLELLL